jgi:CSLREA domain-containing protein
MGYALVMVAAGLLVMLFASSAQAAEIKVTTRLDEFNTNSDECSLREAVQSANNNVDFQGCTRVGPGFSDTILLLAGKVYERSLDGTDNTNAAGDIDIFGPTTFKVRGDGQATIDGNDMDRVLHVVAGSLHASRLVIQNGYSDPQNQQPEMETAGGGVFVGGSGQLVLRSSVVTENNAPDGAGLTSRGVMKLDKVKVIVNEPAQHGGGLVFFGGRLTMDRSTVANNAAAYSGGGIYLSEGEVLITRSTISNNAVTAPNPTGGGGIYTYSGTGQESWRLVNVTISGNNSTGSGGGMFVHAGSPALNAVTITENTADFDGNIPGYGGGIRSSDPLYKVKNSIIAGNIGLTDPAHADCGIGNELPNRNLVGLDTGCQPSEDTIERANPKLNSLDDNGGPTLTHGLKADSAAVGRAGASAPERDQRGVKRDAKPDLGAFERKR